jgi:tungstate transport system substrate-binding protein
MKAGSRVRWVLWALLSVALLISLGACRRARGKTLQLATTTSVQDSGLLEPVLAAFEEASGYAIEVRAVGSGRALEMLAAGDADMALTHSPEDEQAAVAQGTASRRVPVMVNELVLVGPIEHAPVVVGASDVLDAMRRIAGSGKKFVSRADQSGTHRKERALWAAAGVRSMDFVVSANAGMAEALTLASKTEAFALCDRSTFLAHRSALDLVIVFQGDEALRNVYSVVEPKAGAAGSEGARAFADWMRSPAARARIGTFGLRDLGEPLFTPAP